MASRSPPTALRALTTLLICSLLGPSSVLALQVTPNSPCSSTCIDSAALDPSDPNSSNTRNADIICQDAQFGSSAAGIKWQNCMSCLQNSTFSQGSENDQMWFLYNMRYSLSYCIFGFPNASNVQGSPCVTSFACEPLTHSLEDGVLSPQSSTQFGYCSVDNGVVNHDSITRCSSCVAAGGNTQYLSNYLTALDAGCSQQPTRGHILGLNGSVFSPTAIGIVDPATITPTGTPKSGSAGLSSTKIAVLIVIILVVLLIIAAVVFIRIKKRQNRRKRASYATKYQAWGGSTGSGSKQMPQSPLSFQCQTRMGPTSPKFFSDGDDDTEMVDSAYHHHPYHPSSGPAPTTALGRKPSLWKPHNAMSSFQNISAVTEAADKRYSSARTPSGPTSSPPHQNPLQSHPPVPLHSLNTSALPSQPPPSHASPLSGSTSRFSPAESASYTSYTPTSAVSTRSTAPLLPPYVPAAHAPMAGPAPGHNNGGGSPAGLLRGVAAFGRERDGAASTLPPAPPPKSPRMVAGGGGEGGALGFKAKKAGESGSPVESRRLPSVFPPPPPRR